MKAFCLGGSDAAELVEEEIPEPGPGSGEVLVRVCAAGVTPTELSWYPTMHRKDGEKRIQDLTDKYIASIEDIAKAKEKEIMDL